MRRARRCRPVASATRVESTDEEAGLDVTTLRVALTAVAGVLLVLFHFGAYLPTRAAFAGWWTLSLLAFLAGSLSYLANGTSWQAVLNPLGNGFAVLGAEAAWCGARSLRAAPVRWPWLLPVPVVAVVAGMLGDPAHDTWSGGLVFLLCMTAAFAAATGELAVVARAIPARHGTPLASATIPTYALAVASAVLAVFYAGRTVAFAAVGSRGAVFEHWFGTVPTTLLLIVQLVTVSFSMSALSTQQQLDDLRRRAIFDQLTGMYRPHEFRARAPQVLSRLAGDGEIAVVAMADLDHFKHINDDLGHAAGDDVLRAFGWSALAVLGPRALCGRMGGEEFALVFPARDLEHAEAVLGELVADFQRSVKLSDGRVPTVSIGVVRAGARADVAQLLEQADRALYRAKAQGRSRVVRA